MDTVREIENSAPGPAGRAAALIAALAIIVAVYQAGLWTPFVWDDRELVVNDVLLSPEVSAETSLLETFSAPFWRKDSEGGGIGYYRPIVQLSFAIDHRIWGSDPFGFHLTNLMIHLATCALLFGVCVRWGAPSIPASVITLLFGLTPRLSESVLWVSGRTDLLAGLFVMLAFALYPLRGEPGYRRVASALALLLGLLSKEVAIAGVAALTALEFARSLPPRTETRTERTRDWKSTFVRVSPIWLVLALYAVLRQAAVADSTDAMASMAWADRLMLSTETLGRYTLMWLDPLHSAIRIGSVRAPRQIWLIEFGISAALSLLLLARWAWSNRDGRLVVTGWVMIVASLGPVLHLMPVHLDVIAADRLLYLPTLGLGLLAAAGVGRLAIWPKRITAVLACVMCVAFAATLDRRADTWTDELGMWLDAKQHADSHDSVPDAWIAMLLLERDEPAIALRYLQDAMRIETGSPIAPPRKSKTLDYLARISTALSDLGRDAEALHAIEQVVVNDPDNPTYLTQRAVMLARALRFDEAAEQASRTLALAPPSADETKLRNIVAVRGAWQRLPTGSAGAPEPMVTMIARAQIFESIGATRRAEHVWREVLADPALSEINVYRAAQFFSFRSNADEAALVVARLIALRGAHRAEAESLVDYLNEKRLSRVPQQIPTRRAARLLSIAAQ